MKRFKSYIKEDENLKNFEEDTIVFNEVSELNKQKEEEMKTFKQHVNESSYKGDAQGVGVETTTSPEDSVIGAFNIHKEDVLKKVNAFVSSMADKEYLNPQAAVEGLKSKLATIGLNFEAKLIGDNGTTVAEVSQFGGRFGKDLDGSDINDDGISHKKAGGLKIEFKHELLKNGTTKVYAKLV